MERWVRFYFGGNIIFKTLTNFEFKVGDEIVLPIQGEKLFFHVKTLVIDLTGPEPALNLSCTKEKMV